MQMMQMMQLVRLQLNVVQVTIVSFTLGEHTSFKKERSERVSERHAAGGSKECGRGGGVSAHATEPSFSAYSTVGC